jgi:hypothetical protein
MDAGFERPNLCFYPYQAGRGQNRQTMAGKTIQNTLNATSLLNMCQSSIAEVFVIELFNNTLPSVEFI